MLKGQGPGIKYMLSPIGMVYAVPVGWLLRRPPTLTLGARSGVTALCGQPAPRFAAVSQLPLALTPRLALLSAMPQSQDILAEHADVVDVPSARPSSASTIWSRSWTK